jgi:predicted adenine nucleotide alpha hydrolase (AANH) superfamily ATPase
MKTLLHICCAPCSVMCIDTLRNEGIEPVGFWYNPNIQPYTEYKSRREALKEYAKSIELQLVLEDEYNLREFVKNVSPNFDERCEYCYTFRADKAAEHAAENGFDSFTTTLLISPYQNHELLKEVFAKAGEKHGVEFLYRDFRPYFREGQAKARELEIYMQKYCGCVFSEEERYNKKMFKK